MNAMWAAMGSAPAAASIAAVQTLPAKGAKARRRLDPSNCKYDGEALRAIRAKNGVGRPPAARARR